MAEITREQAEKIKAGLRAYGSGVATGTELAQLLGDALALIEQLESDKQQLVMGLATSEARNVALRERGAAGDDLTPYLTAAATAYGEVNSASLADTWASQVMILARALLTAHRAGGGQ